MTAAAVQLLHPLLREPRFVARHVPRADIALEELRLGEARLFLGSPGHQTDVLARHALAIAHGGGVDAWRVVRSASGQPHAMREGETFPISMSAAGDRVGVCLAAGPVGLDIETLDRIALNTGPEDDWLCEDELELLRPLDRAQQMLEIGCRWVIREAFGKAVGRGLAAWREPHAIRVQGGTIRLYGAAAYARRNRWTFLLYRRGSMLLAIARGDPVGSGRDAVCACRQEAAERARGQVQGFEHL